MGELFTLMVVAVVVIGSLRAPRVDWRDIDRMMSERPDGSLAATSSQHEK